MKILTQWLREYLPGLAATDAQLAEDLTLRGIAVEGVFDLGPGNGSLFETDITTNRVDAMNHYGIAREMSAIYGLPLAPLDLAKLTTESTESPGAPFLRALSARRSGIAQEPGHPLPAFSVDIEEPGLCGRFTARVLREVTIQPSSGTIADRFRLLGQKPISNAVDATNYVTLAIGQPTHAFDLDKIDGGLIVRRARKGERIRTLDGIERALDPEDLIVADDLKPVGLAGVMGGYDTMITPETRNIVVEAAWFDPATVRRTARRHGLHTDASHRFERGADFNAAPVANGLVSSIILRSGGHQDGQFIDFIVPAVQARTALRPAISLTAAEVKRILGTTDDPGGITPEAVSTILQALGCPLTQTPGGEFQVQLPSWRLDLDREIDLIEEIARVYGYDRFADTLPPFAGVVVELTTLTKDSALRRTLLATGLNEAISSTFCSAAEAAVFAPQPSSAAAIGNPLSEEAGMLRPSLLPGMVAMLQNNLNRDTADAALFEMGTVFSGNADRVDERPALALGITGNLNPGSPHRQRPRGDTAVSFYDLKGIVEELLARFTVRSVYYDAFTTATGLMPAWLHPGRSARAVVDGSTVGWFGQLHPAEAHSRKLKQPLLLAELYLDRLYRSPLRQPVIAELSRYQAVHRDYSLLFPGSVAWATIKTAIEALTIPELTNLGPREILHPTEAATVPPGHYSLLLAARFQSSDRTLREDELQHYSQLIVATMESLGGQLRSAPTT